MEIRCFSRKKSFLVKEMNLFAKIELWIVMLRNFSFRLLSFVDRNKMSVEFYVDISFCPQNVDGIFRGHCAPAMFMWTKIFCRNFAPVFKMSLEFFIDILLLSVKCRWNFPSTFCSCHFHVDKNFCRHPTDIAKCRRKIPSTWTEAKFG